jgi:MFS family permease
VLIVPGLLVAAAAIAMVSRLTVSSAYLDGVLPAEIVLGLGIGCVFVPAMSTATQRVAPRDAGVAAAVVNTAQQVGGSLGTALLNTIFTTSVASFATANGVSPLSPQAAIHGYNVAFTVSAALLAAGALLVVLFIRKPADTPATEHEATESTAEPVFTH